MFEPWPVGRMTYLRSSTAVQGSSRSSDLSFDNLNDAKTYLVRCSPVAFGHEKEPVPSKLRNKKVNSRGGTFGYGFSIDPVTFVAMYAIGDIL